MLACLSWYQKRASALGGVLISRALRWLGLLGVFIIFRVPGQPFQGAFYINHSVTESGLNSLFGQNMLISNHPINYKKAGNAAFVPLHLPILALSCPGCEIGRFRVEQIRCIQIRFWWQRLCGAYYEDFYSLFDNLRRSLAMIRADAKNWAPQPISRLFTTWAHSVHDSYPRRDRLNINHDPSPLGVDHSRCAISSSFGSVFCRFGLLGEDIQSQSGNDNAAKTDDYQQEAREICRSQYATEETIRIVAAVISLI